MSAPSDMQFNLHLNVEVASKQFGENRILEDVQLQVPRGEIVSLVGPSGCGKSTLLRIVAGLDQDYRGSRQIEGKVVTGISREAGFIFQEPRLFPWLTVAENVALHVGRIGEGLSRARALLAQVGLDGYSAAFPKQLSGGQAQRVSIARGLFTRPSLLLLDEPFSAVDAFTRMKLQDLLLTIAQLHEITLLLVTHDVDEALYLSDRVVVMGTDPGRILNEFDVAIERPRDRRNPALAELKSSALTKLYAAHAI